MNENTKKALNIVGIVAMVVGLAVLCYVGIKYAKQIPVMWKKFWDKTEAKVFRLKVTWTKKSGTFQSVPDFFFAFSSKYAIIDRNFS